MGNKITGKQRMEAAFKNEQLDRIPVFLLLGSHLAEKAGYTLEQSLTEPEAALETMKVTLDTLESDVAFVPFNPFMPDAQEAIRKLMGKTPSIKREDIKEKLPKWRVRKPNEDPLFASHLSVCEKTVNMFPEHHIETLIGGPWSFALELRGITEAILDTVDDKEFIHRLMEHTTGTVIQRCLAVSELGITSFIGDPSAGMSLISPDIYRQFVYPYHQKIVNAIHDQGSRVVFHICGHIDPILEDLVSLGVDGISLDAPSSLEKMFEVGRGKTVIIGNINPIIFLEATPQQLDEEIKKCLDVSGKDPTYAIGPGCQIPLGTPLENIQHFIDTCHELGAF